ncbi:uncharacterized protein C6orf136 homolog isoform X2 [Betta splendens]|uniref:Uncharacterized protein C6orf136 homolog isoform X2 n=1 Tax=Betta splendens TaxID=158456 RepID=A0A6P7NYV8_BETSP|nr:uncharacterized protein C6orf136 homolog isoform X2 [Betta splendens]
MAVSRGGIAFWEGCVRSHSRRQSFKNHNWILSQAVRWIHLTRPLSSATWALAPPNSLQYQYIKQPMLLHPYQLASQLQKGGISEENREEPLGTCVLMQQAESNGFHSLVEVSVLGRNKLVELFAPGLHQSSEVFFTLTTVDGSREDDISIRFKENAGDSVKREHGCFRSLFEAEKCPAPFTYGSQFYCFHCPGTEPEPGTRLKTGMDFRIVKKLVVELPLTSLCRYSTLRENTKEGGEVEKKLAVMYERLRIELPSVFVRNHDYTMYSNDVEFINGLINARTRGRVWYKFTLSLWRFLCLCYYADVHLEVLKLTKHMEDGTIRARWRIWGLPFHSLLLCFYRKEKSRLYRSYDAFSTFYIGQDGLIHCHKVEKVMPDQPPVLPRVTSLLTGALVVLGVQEHRPALNLLPFLLSSL